MSASSYKLLLNDFYTRTRELIDRCESEERITVSGNVVLNTLKTI